MICILANGGASSRDDPERRSKEWRPTLRREPPRREVRTPTARPDGVARAVAAAPVSHCRETKAWVPAENRHGGAPRGVPVAPGQGGRASQARPNERVRLSALHPPLIGGTELCCRDGRWRQGLVGSPADAKAKAHAKRRRNPGAATRRGNEEHCAVSHREYDDGQRFAVRAPRCRTRRARSTPVARRMQTARRSGSVVFRTAQR